MASKFIASKKEVRHQIISAEVTSIGADIRLSDKAWIVFIRRGEDCFAVDLDSVEIKRI